MTRTLRFPLVVGAVTAIAGVLASPAGAQAALNTFSGSCSAQEGRARFDPPLVQYEVDGSHLGPETAFSFDLAAMTCNGSLNGMPPTVQTATLVLSGTGRLSCVSGKPDADGVLRFSRGTTTPVDDLQIAVLAKLRNHLFWWDVDLRGASGGSASGTLFPTLDAQEDAECVTHAGIEARSFRFGWRTASPLASTAVEAEPLRLDVTVQRQSARSLLKAGLVVNVRANAPVSGKVALTLDRSTAAGTRRFAIAGAAGGVVPVRVRLGTAARRLVASGRAREFTVAAAARHVHGKTATARTQARIGGSAQSAPPQPPGLEYATWLVSGLGSGGPPGEGPAAFGTAISADGRYVVFGSNAANFPGAGAGARLYRKDLQSGEFVLVSRRDGVNGASMAGSHPTVSPDGRHVCWMQQPETPTANEHTFGHVYVRDIEAGRTRTVAELAEGGDDDDPVGATKYTGYCGVSPDGDEVVFLTAQSHDPSDVRYQDVYLYEFSSARYTRLTGDAPGSRHWQYGASSQSSFSADGRYVAFLSRTDKPGGLGAFPALHLYVRELTTGRTTQVDLPPGCDHERRNTSGFTHEPALSADGRYVAFSSDLVLDPDATQPFVADATQQVYVRDRETCTTTLVSRAAGHAGAVGNRSSRRPTISADGRLVAFVTQSDNLDPTLRRTRTRKGTNVYIRDWRAGRTAVMSRASGVFGDAAHGSSAGASLSADGRRVSFLSDADNLVGLPTANRQVYVRDILGSRGLLPADLPGPPRAAAAYRRGRDGAEDLVMHMSEWAQTTLEVTPLGGRTPAAVHSLAAPEGTSRVSLTRSLPPGRYRVTVRAEDLGGHRSENRQTIRVGRPR